MESWERMKQAVAGRWTGKPGKTGTTVLNPSESRGTVPGEYEDGDNVVAEETGSNTENTTNTASSMTKKIQTEGRGCLC